MDRYIISSTLKTAMGELDHSCGQCKMVLTDNVLSLSNQFTKEKLTNKVFEKFNFSEDERNSWNTMDGNLITGLDYLNRIDKILKNRK